MIAKCLKKGISGVALALMIAFTGSNTYGRTASDIALDSVENYLAYQTNMRLNDPNAYGKQRLQVVNERRRHILASEQAELDAWVNNARYAGVSEEAIASRMQEKVLLSSLSGSKRLDNYLRRQKGEENTFDDFDFKYDVENTNIEYLEAKYGKEVADYAYSKHREQFRKVRDELEKPKKGLFSWFSD